MKEIQQFIQKFSRGQEFAAGGGGAGSGGGAGGGAGGGVRTSKKT